MNMSLIFLYLLESPVLGFMNLARCFCNVRARIMVAKARGIPSRIKIIIISDIDIVARVLP